MRKKIVTIAGVLLVLAALCMVEYSAVNRMTGDALLQMEDILDMVRRGELDTGLEKVRALNAYWDERARGLEILADHSDAEEVRTALVKLIAALEGEDRSMAMIYARETEKSIEHVRERQAMTLQNML